MKKFTVCLLLLSLCILMGSSALAQQNIKILINGKVMQPEIPVQIVEGSVMVPLRFVAEALKAEVNWNEQKSTVEITNNIPDYKLMKLNGKQTTWPYWEENGEVYMEVHNYVELMRLYYSNHYSVSLGNTHIMLNQKSFRYSSVIRGDFETVSMQKMWDRGDLVPFVWDSAQGNLVVEKLKNLY